MISYQPLIQLQLDMVKCLKVESETLTKEIAGRMKRLKVIKDQVEALEMVLETMPNQRAGVVRCQSPAKKPSGFSRSEASKVAKEAPTKEQPK